MTSPSPPTSHSSSSIPIVVISILGITTTVALLLAYYFFIMRCFFRSRLRGPHTTTNPSRRSHPLPPFLLDQYPYQYHRYDFSPRGLDDSTIRSLPIVAFRRSASPLYHECAVCLSSFLENEKLRLLPGCAHHFHIDCVDTWLHSTPTCPLCRAHVSPFDLLATAQLGHPVEGGGGGDEEGGRPTTANAATSRPAGRKLSMGDECLVGRSTKEGAGLWSPVQPMRRSISMDSSTERQLCLAVQEALTLRREREEGSGRIRRTLFSFGHGRSSRSAVLPLRVVDV